MPRLHLPPDTNMAKVPCTIVTGFLGSGKSTLVNHILRHCQREGPLRRNVAVIENEFGEVSVDTHLVGDQLLERENLVSMEGGCVCCSLRNDVVKAFAELERRAKARNTQHDHILLETTGLADPSPLAFTFFANPWIAARFSLDSIICVVDARHLMQHLVDFQPGGDVNEAVQQLAFADLILLNKVDLVTDEAKEEVRVSIKHVNNTARIVECKLDGESIQLPSMDSILGTNTFSVSRALEVDPEFMDSDSATSDEEEDSHCTHVHTPRELQGASSTLEQGAAAEGLHAQQQQQQQQGQPQLPQQSQQQQQGAGVESSCEGSSASDRTRHSPQEPHGTKRKPEDAGILASSKREKEKRPKRRRKMLHDMSDISSVGFQAHGMLDEYRFNMFMRDLLTEKAKDIYRCKGVLAVHGYGNKKFVFQGVHETICYGPADHPWKEGEVPVNQIVFIGRDLDRKALVQGFRTCVWSPLPEGWVQTTDPRTGQPFYWNKETRERSWLRPPSVPVVSVHHASTEQPKGVPPSRLCQVGEPAGCRITVHTSHLGGEKCKSHPHDAALMRGKSRA